MKEMQSFLMFFYILDQCYDQCPENDLGGFLGSISPELWEDGKPMPVPTKSETMAVATGIIIIVFMITIAFF